MDPFFSESSLAALKFGYISRVIYQSLRELEWWRRKPCRKFIREATKRRMQKASSSPLKARLMKHSTWTLDTKMIFLPLSSCFADGFPSTCFLLKLKLLEGLSILYFILQLLEHREGGRGVTGETKKMGLNGPLPKFYVIQFRPTTVFSLSALV